MSGLDEREGTKKDFDTRVLHSFAKNAAEEVRVEVGQFYGKDVVNVRVYFENDEGKRLPSKKGIAMALNLVPELKKGVDLAHAEYLRMVEDGKLTAPEKGGGDA